MGTTRVLRATMLAVITGLLLVVVGGGTASAVTYENSCGELPSYNLYKIRSHRTACRNARAIAKRFMDRGGKPFGYRCSQRIRTTYTFDRCQRKRGTRNFIVIFYEYPGR